MRRALALLALGLGLAGCGLGAGEKLPGGVELRVTRDFGERLIGSTRRDGVRGGDTVMRLLRSSQRDVQTRYGGRFVQSIGGLSGRGPGGRRDWFFFVNGLESELGAAEYALNDGDRVLWDYRDWRATMTVPAIVGAFPEPLLHGTKGKRFPVRMECEDEDGAPCREVKRRLTDSGVKTSSSAFGADATQNVLRVIVARWPKAGTVQAVGRLTGKPDQSGVFARFEGDRLQLVGEDGETVRDAAPGTGLVAALRPGPKEILWVVTGNDQAGLQRAAESLSERSLQDAFALAATPEGPRKLPLRGER